MAEHGQSQAKVLLLAVQIASTANIPALRALVSQYRKALRTDILLRILLTYLPESLASSEYVPFLKDLASGEIEVDDGATVDIPVLDEISEETANKRVRKLHLLPLAWPSTPLDATEDPFILFLIHRAYRIDQETGLIAQLPELIVPFLNHSQYLRTWMISTLLPLIRLNYEYYPQQSTIQAISAFEGLDDATVVGVLLSRTGKTIGTEGDTNKTIGRDLRGLVGPWMYGESIWKRRKLRTDSDGDAQNIPFDEEVVGDVDKSSGWEETFKWIVSQAATSWVTSVEAIEQWDGPSDVDIADYGNGTVWLEETEQQGLEGRYARAALAAAYTISEVSIEALIGVQRILARLITLLDYDRIPTLTAAAALLAPISATRESTVATSKNVTFLRTGLTEERNVLTTPNAGSISFLHGLLISAYLFSRAGIPCTIRRAGELILLQDEREQTFEVQRLIHKLGSGPKGDDKYWIRMRNELLWLRDWGAEEPLEGTEGSLGRGALGKVKKDFLEMEILKALLSNTRYSLARSIYETSAERPLSAVQMRDTVISAAMNAYDNASNANRTRGGVKKCDDIIHAFPETLRMSIAEKRIDHLLVVTHSIGQYRLVLKQGEPFTPVVLRVHSDPISIIGKVLDQNPRSYTKINDFVHMGEQMVLAGLTVRDVEGHTIIGPQLEEEHMSIAKKRIVSMCIDAALSEDDFETAYSYVMTRLSSIASEAQARMPLVERSNSGIFAQPPPVVLDDWSWRAALQAGKYRPNRNTVRPTHLGTASGNPEIRHLEQRKDCLSQALRIAPPATLHEILNVFRRCQEELDTKITEEVEQEAAWDDQGDQAVMPGGFGVDQPGKTSRAVKVSDAAEEAPMSLFDLTRVSAAKAQSSLSALTTLSGGAGRGARGMSGLGPDRPSPATGPGPGSVRKRDQLRNAAVGTLASGIGWLINAPAPTPEE